MKPSQIFDIMDLARRARKQGRIFNPCFIGAPGLGKTEILQQWCVKNNLPYITLTSAMLEAPDIRGFPIVEVVDGRQRQTCAIPDFWPSEGEGVVILEEVNRGPTSVMNCWMALTDNRRGFDSYKLPEGWLVAAAINPDSEHYDVNTMDVALKDRFEMFTVEYDKNTFLDYANSNNWDKSVIQFVETDTWTYNKPEDLSNNDNVKYTSPRTFSKLNAARKAGIPESLELSVYSSILGFSMGTAFYSFVHDDKPVMFEQLKTNLKPALAKLRKFSDPENYKSGMIGLTVKDLLSNAEDVTLDLLNELVQVIPVDQSMGLISAMEYKLKKSDILNTLLKKHPQSKKILKEKLVA